MTAKLFTLSAMSTLLFALSACSTMSDMLPNYSDTEKDPLENKPSTLTEPALVDSNSSFLQQFLSSQTLKRQLANLASAEDNSSKNTQALLTKNINHYVRGLMQDMAENLQFVNATTPVAVASFVFLDGPYDKTSLLGNQIAESFIHEIRKFNIPVLDFKTTGWVMVTPDGDFAQSRDYEELSIETEISYIVTGTLVKHQGGYLVNARMVGMKSKAVVASAQSLIPTAVADALMDRQKIQKEQGSSISIVQG